jgi:hypothetical protein
VHPVLASLVTTLVLLVGALIGLLAARSGMRGIVSSPEYATRFRLNGSEVALRRERFERAGRIVALILGTICIWAVFGFAVHGHSAVTTVFGPLLVALIAEVVWLVIAWLIFRPSSDHSRRRLS